MNEAGGSRRFLIRRAWWLRPLLLLVGLTTDANSYAVIEGERLRVRFGWFFNQTFALTVIEGVAPMRWPWYYGLGWRTNLRGLVGVVASMRGVVQIRFRQRQRVGIIPLVKLRCDRLAVSLEEPETFMAALNEALGDNAL